MKVLAGPKVRFSTATKERRPSAAVTESKLSLSDRSPRVNAVCARSEKKKTAVATTGGVDASRLKRNWPAHCGEGTARTPRA